MEEIGKDSLLKINANMIVVAVTEKGTKSAFFADGFPDSPLRRTQIKNFSFAKTFLLPSREECLDLLNSALDKLDKK